MSNFLKVLGGYAGTAAAVLAPYLVDGAHAIISGIPDTGPLSSLIKIGLGLGLGAISARVLHKADPGDPATGAASGAAFENASKGPFAK